MPEPEVARQVKAWIARAKHDLKAIEYLLPHGDAPLEAVCFHAQQAAEKYLKALLTHYGVPFRKTHDLPELVLSLPKESAVPDAVGDLTALTDAGVSARYPDDLVEYDRALTEALVNQARVVEAAVEAELRAQEWVPEEPGQASQQPDA